LLLAAGEGRRLGGIAKAFIELNGQTLLQHGVRLLSTHAHQIIVGVRPTDIVSARKQISALHLPAHIKALCIAGGQTRQETLDRLLAAATGSHVLIHEVARPWVETADIEQLLQAAHKHDAIALFSRLPVRDSLALTRDGKLERILPRNDLISLQTPHLYRRETLLRVHALAAHRGWQEDSTAALLMRAGVDLHLVEGSPHNLKITFPEDLALMGAQTSSAPTTSVHTAKSIRDMP
jgi:2-C-methyl-D-erythritol 4-phosphate cytidylyltransferase